MAVVVPFVVGNYKSHSKGVIEYTTIRFVAINDRLNKLWQ